ncbi:MAG: hypothetical protein JW749_07535 [Sedimentisphaerales bacterium]|nr:hypothetical protein [Sedimentisphaerales bacterium]
MTNRVDFYQGHTSKLTIPAGAAVVFVEGGLCPYLEVLEIVQAGSSEYGSARLRYNPAADSGGQILSVEDIEREIGIDTPVSIKWIHNNLYPAAGAEGIVIFAGQVERFDKTLEGVEIIVRDYSATLERITVVGRRVQDINGRVVCLDVTGTIFNEAGQPNATNELIEYEGKLTRLFAADSRDAKPWDCADVIRYLLCEYVPTGQLIIPDESRLRAIMQTQSVRNLDVTGLSILEATERVGEQAGIEFKFVPTSEESGPRQAIVFYKKGAGRQVELNLQKAGQQISVSKTNVIKASSRGGFWPATHRYIGLGDYKVFEATFYLVETWRPEQESVDYDLYSPSTNPNFVEVKNVFRRFALNEAGDYSDQPYEQGPAYDFLRIFGTDKYVHRRRRFWPALSRDAEGKSLGYFLEVSYDEGEHWRLYMHAFDILLDECGIWLASDRLDINTWVAAIKSVLKFRITASVVSDQRLTCSSADGPVGSTVPVVNRIISLPNRFKFRKVTGKSQFSSVVNDSIGSPDEADDSTALYQFIRQRAQAKATAIETFDIQTPHLALGFEVGDVVKTNPDDRDIFSTGSDNRSTSVIEKVRMNFEKQATELRVVRRRML